jgi:hypothetical protein
MLFSYAMPAIINRDSELAGKSAQDELAIRPKSSDALENPNIPHGEGDLTGLEVAEGTGLSITTVGDGLSVLVGIYVKVGEGGKVLVGLGVSVGIGEGVKIIVGDSVGDSVGNGVQVLNGVEVLEGVSVSVTGVGEEMDGMVHVGIGVFVGRAVMVGEGLGVSVGGAVTPRANRANNRPVQ